MKTASEARKHAKQSQEATINSIRDDILKDCETAVNDASRAGQTEVDVLIGYKDDDHQLFKMVKTKYEAAPYNYVVTPASKGGNEYINFCWDSDV